MLNKCKSAQPKVELLSLNTTLLKRKIVDRIGLGAKTRSQHKRKGSHARKIKRKARVTRLIELLVEHLLKQRVILELARKMRKVLHAKQL